MRQWLSLNSVSGSKMVNMKSIICLLAMLIPLCLAGVDQSNVVAGQLVAVTPLDNSGVHAVPDYVETYDNFLPSLMVYDSFDWTLAKRVATLTSENVLVSPLGLKLGLAILKEAATGATQAEIDSVLGFDQNPVNVRNKFTSILNSLESKSSHYILNLGSRIYVKGEAGPRQMFAAIAEEFYKTEIRKASFEQPLVAVQEINTWVSNLTSGRIPDLVTEGDIVGAAVIVLNTLYFKGSWVHQFPPNNTKPGTFFVTPELPKQVDFMTVKERFFYAESTKLDAKILRLPYRGKKFSMNIIVPNSITGLSKVMNNLNELSTEMLYMQDYQVDVTIPKIKFEFTSHLDGVLKDLGIRQAFEDTASFPGLARGQLLQNRLKISSVLQRSGIEVNEVGSVVYSATQFLLGNKFGEDTISMEVIANKPFLFTIEDEATRQLLFIGLVNDPSLTDGVLKTT